MLQAWHSRVLNSRLLPKLAAVIVLVIMVYTAVVWWSVDYFALGYFSDLLEKYHVPKKAEVMDMFLQSAHKGLIWASLISLTLGLVLGVVLIKMILGPLHQMIAITRTIAAGDFTRRVQSSPNDEIGELSRAFNTMADSLQRIEELRKRMVVDLAHELRAPLTNIRGYLEALSTGVMPPTPKTIEAVHEETVRLSNLTEDLMRLSVADAARLSLRTASMDLQDLLMHSMKLFESHFAEKSITVETHFEGATEVITADAEKLQQIFQNLIDNAWRYTPENGHFRISIERTAGWIKAIFATTGDAIAEDHLPLIFERFYRVDASRSRELGGAGIGLAIAKELVLAHGGEVGAESSPGENRIWFTLPA